MVDIIFSKELRYAILKNNDEMPFKFSDLPNEIEADGMMHQFKGGHYIFREDENKTIWGRIFVDGEPRYSIKYDVRNIEIRKNKKFYYKAKLSVN